MKTIGVLSAITALTIGYFIGRWAADDSTRCQVALCRKQSVGKLGGIRRCSGHYKDEMLRPGK